MGASDYSTTIRIERGTLDALSAIAHLERRLRDHQIQHAVIRHLHEVDRDGLAVAFVGEDPVAYIHGCLRAVEKTGMICGLATLGEYRGLGIATLLLEAELARQEEAGKVASDVAVPLSDESAIAFFREAGFIDIGEISSRYGYDEERLLMQRYVCEIDQRVKASGNDAAPRIVRVPSARFGELRQMDAAALRIALNELHADIVMSDDDDSVRLAA